MSMSINKSSNDAGESIPFYRNVKIIGIIAQIIFLILLLLGIGFIVNNVRRGAGDLNIPLGFNWLNSRSGIPLSESPIPYEIDQSYGRVILVGFLNTLKVSLLGVVLATLLGIATALMRLSSNWVLKQIATIYIESVRNIPLAIQIFFWFTVLLIPSLPIGVNGISIGQAFLNNSTGFAIPWPYYNSNTGLWLPWLIVAIILGSVIFYVRRRQIIASERPGNPWPPALIAFAVVSLAGYFVGNAMSSHPDGLLLDVNERRGSTRLTSYLDADGNGEFSSRADETVRGIPLRVTLDEGQLDVIPDKRREVGQTVLSSFRFPRLRANEFGTATVAFENPEIAEAEGLSFHFDKFPSIGRIYQDRNDNGRLDFGEDRRTTAEVDAGVSEADGYEGVDYRVILTVTDFQRHLVTDHYGEITFPPFEGENKNTQVEILPSSLFSWSRPSFPTERTLIVGGNSLSNAYMALLLALVFYTATFIAEIVRGGILSVPKGQREASQAIGLSGSQTFRLVVFPQAMRIIIPPMISQFLNLTKNSSLGFLAAYPEFAKVSEIVMGQSGASVPVIIILIIGYLMISLTFSLILNIFNNRVKLVER